MDVKVSLRERIGYVKHLKRNFELLKIKTEFLLNARDAMKEEISKELLQGKIPTNECRAWLEEVEEINHQAWAIIDAVEAFEQRCLRVCCPGISLLMELGEKMVNIINEISVRLERKKRFFQLGLMVDTSPNLAERITRPRIETETISGPVETTKMIPIRKREASGKAKASEEAETTAWGKEARIEEQAQLIQRRKEVAWSMQIDEITKREETEILPASDTEVEITYLPISEGKQIPTPGIESKMMPVQRSKAGITPAAKVESMMKPIVTEDDESVPEMIPISITENVCVPEIIPASGLEAEFTPEKIPVPRTEGKMLAVSEIEIEMIPSETKAEAELVLAPSSRHGIEGKMMTMQRKAGMTPAAQVEGMMTPAVTEDEMAPETIPISIPEIVQVPETPPVPSTEAELKSEKIFVPRTVGKISPTPETGIEMIPSECRGEAEMVIAPRTTAGRSIDHTLQNAGAKLKLEKIPVPRTVGKISTVPEIGIEMIPSGCKGEDEMVTVPRTTARRSIDRTLQRIFEKLKDVTVRKIGIYGRGGIGKTTVLKALNDQSEVKSMFDVIIWVTVSKDLSLIEMQNEIARQLSLHLPNNESNASILFQMLDSKKFLLLLDDVWEWIDLDGMGIPKVYPQNGCKIVMTTRSIHICQTMETDWMTEVDVVSKEESWELFCENVGGIIDSSNIQPFARTIVEECGGLPLMLIVYGKALRNEMNVSVWRHALKELLSLTTSGIEGVEYVVQQLKFCYDRLRDANVKSCFLSCAMYPEDREINIAELIEHWIAEGFIIGNLEEAHKKGHGILKDLVDSSLLESIDGSLCVKMHDVIRDLALGIMSLRGEDCQVLVRADVRLTEPPKWKEQEQEKIFQMDQSSRLLESQEIIISSLLEGHRFISRAGLGLTQPPKDMEWEQAERIFLMDNKLTSLPKSPNCPKLLTLFLQRNYFLRMIPESFFDHMPSLQVLNLSKTRIKLLPSSISKLVNLRELILRDCERLDVLPSEVGALTHLEVLDLHGADISNLPDEIGELTCLRQLQVSFYGYVNRGKNIPLPPELISYGTISRLVLLKDLSIVVDPEDQRWSDNVKAFTEEVIRLKDLTTLHYYFPEVEHLECFIKVSPSWNDQNLRMFRFIIGHHVKRFVSRVPVDVEVGYEQHDRCLRFVNGLSIPGAVLEILTRSSAFYLDHHCEVYSLSEFGVGNMNELKFCIISECPKIENIIDGMQVIGSALPLLEYLSIHYLWNLKSIWVGPGPLGSLARLKSLTLQTCPKLQYIFSPSMLQHLSNLEELLVEDCQEIKAIIEDVTVEYDILLPRLKRLSLHYVPELVSIWKGAWHTLEQISIYNCPKLKKLSMGFQFPDSVKEIKGERDWWNEVEWEETALFLRLQPFFMPICDDDL